MNAQAPSQAVSANGSRRTRRNSTGHSSRARICCMQTVGPPGSPYLTKVTICLPVGDAANLVRRFDVLVPLWIDHAPPPPSTPSALLGQPVPFLTYGLGSPEVKKTQKCRGSALRFECPADNRDTLDQKTATRLYAFNLTREMGLGSDNPNHPLV